MDDGIVLNLAGDDDTSSSKSVSVKKGGRWTDRCVSINRQLPAELN